MMLKSWFAERHFNKQCQQLANSPLADIYSVPDRKQLSEQAFEETSFFVLDFETTGLNPKTDRVLSMGFTSIENGRILLGKSEHYYVRHTKKIPDKTAIIHHITEQEAATGVPIKEAFPYLLKQLSGKVLVAHFADIEIGFLQQIAKTLYNITLPIIYLDTLQIAFHLKYKDAVHIPQNALNLFSLRQQYDLPNYKAHNAMADAVSTAELLLVQVSDINPQPVIMKQLLKMQ